MTIEEFTPKHKFLICIDSDGCAVDSMTIKHKKAFGRALIETWHLEDYKDKVMAEWERINLYSMTRGINRFLGLNMALNYINQNIKPIDGLADLTKFIETAKSYSNNALEEYIKSNPSKLLEECLSWSNLTNKYIKELPESSINLFKNVKDQIKRMTDNSDIAVVSSANYDAVYNEWKRLGLMEEAYRKRHILRLNRGECTISNFDYYVDILSNLERIGDHTDNIASNVIYDDYQSLAQTGLKAISNLEEK